MQHDPQPSPSGLEWDWNDVRVFLTCVKLGSFRKAADQLGLNSSTVMRRIEAFETRLGFPLLNRLHDGVSPTPAGAATLTAPSAWKAFYDVLRKVPAPDAERRGTVRISITEGLGIYWVMPRLVGFAQQHRACSWICAARWKARTCSAWRLIWRCSLPALQPLN
jgi:DNA-binding transcriptional LysR family regulator